MQNAPLASSPIYDTVPFPLTGYNTVKQPVPKPGGHPDFASTKLIVTQPEHFSGKSNHLLGNDLEKYQFSEQSGVVHRECCAVICCNHSLSCK